MNLGLGLAFISALAIALRNVYNRKNVLETDEYVTAWAMKCFPLPFMALGLLYFGLPEIGAAFYWAFPLNLVTGVIGSIFMTRAFKYAEVSVATPLFALKPALLLATSPILLGEIPSLNGYIGVLVIVLGTYLLNAHDVRAGFLTPFRSLAHNTGARYVFAIVLMGGVMYNVTKIGVESTSPFFWAVATYSGMLVGLTPIVWHYSDSSIYREVTQRWQSFSVLGLVIAVNIIAQYAALELTLAAYVSAVKQFSSVFGVIFGYLIFKEGRLWQKLVSAGVMVVGVALVTL